MSVRFVYKISLEIQHDLSMINLPANLELRCWLETPLPSWDQSSVTEDTYKDGASLHLTHQIHSGPTLLNSHAAPVAKYIIKVQSSFIHSRLNATWGTLNKYTLIWIQSNNIATLISIRFNQIALYSYNFNYNRWV